VAFCCIALAALAALGGAAGAQTFPPLVAPPEPSASSSPACGKSLVASAGTPKSRGGVVVETITLALHTGTPCVVAGFPDIVFAGHAGASTLRTGRLSNPSSALLDPQTQATFTLRYVRAPGASAAGCALSIIVAGAPAGGAPLPIAPCQAVSEVDVSSYTSVSQGATASPLPLTPARASKSTRRCGTADLAVRDAGSEPGAGTIRALIAVQNRSLTSCTVARAMHAQLLGTQGRLMAVTVVSAQRPSGGDLALRAGHEASLTLSFGTTDCGVKRARKAMRSRSSFQMGRSPLPLQRCSRRAQVRTGSQSMRRRCAWVYRCPVRIAARRALEVRAAFHRSNSARGITNAGALEYAEIQHPWTPSLAASSDSR